MAANTPQEKEWVPRSHIVGPGAMGTLTRASANRAKLFMQLIDEEKEEAIAAKARPDVGGAYTEVALIRCKNDADGVKYVKLMKTLIGKRDAGEAYHQIFQLRPGSGVTYSEYLLISVGSPEAYTRSHNDRTPDDVAELVRLVKHYDSTIYLTKATDDMKEIVANLNARQQSDKNIIALEGKNTYTGNPVNITIAESPQYRFETGQKLVSSFLEKTGNNLMERVERIESVDAEGMGKIEKALLELYGAEHRNNAAHEWRPKVRSSIGFSALLNTPLAHVRKLDDTHMEVVTFDLLTDFAQDARFAETSQAIKDAVGAIKEITVYVHSKESEKKLKFEKGLAGTKEHPELTFTQTHHIFGNAAVFNVIPGTPQLA